jgi:acyl-CoA hydrolase
MSGMAKGKFERKPDRTPVTLLEEIFPGDTNPYGTAFGGKVLALMDRAAALAASRYAHSQFVTASLEEMSFDAAVKQGEVAEVEARVVYTSTRTCGIQVRVSALDKIEWVRRPCGSGFIFMVAVGPEGQILPVPAFKPSGKQEQETWRQVADLHRRILKRKNP